ncbi:MAG: MFS transporter [Acidobacteria bacterium]|nr:MFS transporter [Acidobacteriota bacterium]
MRPPAQPDVRQGNVRNQVILALLALAMALAFFDRMNFSVALADPGFLRAFHLDDQDRGVLNSAFYWSYALLQMPAGWLVDRYGVRWPFALGFLCWSAATAATAISTSVATLIALRILLGIGESVLSPVMMRWIRLNMPESRSGLAVGIVMLGSKLGPALGAPLSAWLLVRWGWPQMFLILGMIPILWVVPWLLLVRDRSTPLAPSQPGQNGGFANISVAAVLVASFCYQYFIYFCLTWMPAYVVEAFHLDITGMGWYSMVAFGGTAVIAVAAGYAADRLIARGQNALRVRASFAIAGLALASTEIASVFVTHRSAALFITAFALSAAGLVTPNHWALGQLLVPARFSGKMAGMQACAAGLPGIAAPLFTAWLKSISGGYALPVITVAVILVIGMLCYLVVLRSAGSRISDADSPGPERSGPAQQ